MEKEWKLLFRAGASGPNCCGLCGIWYLQPESLGPWSHRVPLLREHAERMDTSIRTMSAAILKAFRVYGLGLSAA